MQLAPERAREVSRGLKQPPRPEPVAVGPRAVRSPQGDVEGRDRRLQQEQRPRDGQRGADQEVGGVWGAGPLGGHHVSGGARRGSGGLPPAARPCHNAGPPSPEPPMPAADRPRAFNLIRSFVLADFIT
ncbi:MAG: hypothetical protein ACK559_30140, partial [bacterium]